MESQAKLKAHPQSGLKQFVTTESPLKVMKNAFSFIAEGIFKIYIYI